MGVHWDLTLHLVQLCQHGHIGKSNSEGELQCQDIAYVHEYNEDCRRAWSFITDTNLRVFAEGIQLANLFDRGRHD